MGNSRQYVVILAVGVMLGGFAGYLVAFLTLDGGPESPGGAVSREADAAAVAQQPRASGPSTTSPLERSQGSHDHDGVPPLAPSSEPARAPDVTAIDLIARALGDLKPVDNAPGQGAIVGKITDAETGDPVGGVLVQALGRRQMNLDRINPPVRFEPPSHQQLIDSILRSAERTLDTHSLTYHTYTASDGSYALNGLAEGDVVYRISPRAADYEFRYAPPPGGNEFLVGDAPPGSEINFTASRRFAVEFEVYLPDGSPALGAELKSAWVPTGVDREGARLNAASYSYRTELSWGGPGTFRYKAPGLYAFRATPKPEHGVVACEDVVVEVGPGLPNRVVFHFVGVPGLIVRVRDESGRVDSASSYSIAAMPWQDDLPPTQIQLQGYRNLGRGRTASEPQTFYPRTDKPALLRELSVERHVVVATERDKIVAFAFVQVRPHAQELTLVVKPPAADSVIRLIVREPDGSLISEGVGYELRATNNGATTSRSGSPERLTDGSHRIYHFELPRGFEQSGAATTWTLAATHSAHGFRSALIDRSSTRELTIQFESPAVLRFEVAGMASHPARARLQAELQTSIPGEASLWTQPPARGVPTSTGFVFPPQQPGIVKVTLALMIGDRGRIILGQRTQTLVSGDNVHRLALPTLHSLTVRAANAEPGLNVSVALVPATDSNPESARSEGTIIIAAGADGSAVFDFLPPGSYTVQALVPAGASYTSTTVTIPGTSEVRLTR